MELPTEKEIFERICSGLEVIVGQDYVKITPPNDFNYSYMIGYSDQIKKFINDISAEGKDVHLDLSKVSDLENGVLSVYYTACREKAEKEGKKLFISGITSRHENWLRKVLDNNAQFEVLLYRETEPEVKKKPAGLEFYQGSLNSEQKPKSNFWKYATATSLLLGTALAYVLAFQPVPDLPPVTEDELRFEKVVVLKRDKDRLDVPTPAPVKTPMQEEYQENLPAPELPQITLESIDDVLKKDKAVIDIWAPWCGPCKMYSKPFAQTAAKYDGKEIYFAKMNFDNNTETIKRLVEKGVLKEDVNAIPCTIFVKDGKEIDRFTGGNVPKLKEMINQHYLDKEKK